MMMPISSSSVSEALTHRGQIKNQIKHHKCNFIAIHALKIINLYDLYKKTECPPLKKSTGQQKVSSYQKKFLHEKSPTPADVSIFSINDDTIRVSFPMCMLLNKDTNFH